MAAPFAGLGVRLRKVLSPGHVTVGLFVVANAAPGLPPAIAEYLRSGADRAMLSYPYYPLARLLGVVLQLAIGLWLFLGTETLTVAPALNSSVHSIYKEDTQQAVGRQRPPAALADSVIVGQPKTRNVCGFSRARSLSNFAIMPGFTPMRGAD